MRKAGHNFVVILFIREDPIPHLQDAEVAEAMKLEKVQPVSQDDFAFFRASIWLPKMFEQRLAAFGDTVSGPNPGNFSGVPFIDLNGEMKVEENWTRGPGADIWKGDWGFVFKEL